MPAVGEAPRIRSLLKRNLAPFRLLRFWQRQFEDSVLEAGLGLVGVNRNRQRNPSYKRAAHDFMVVVISLLRLSFLARGGANCHGVITHTDVDIFLVHTRQLGVQDNSVILVHEINTWQSSIELTHLMQHRCVEGAAKEAARPEVTEKSIDIRKRPQPL